MITYKRFYNPGFLTKEPNGQFKKYFKAKNLVWASSGRGNFEVIIDMLDLNPDEVVLVPAFAAQGILLPFKRKRVKCFFYKSNRYLVPDLEDVKRLIEKNKVKAFVLVHYFGYPQPTEEIISILKDHSVYLIEDCAQAFLSRYMDGSPIGTKGDFALFSLPKFLPVPDGSLLIINNKRFSEFKIEYKTSMLYRAAILSHLIFLQLVTWQRNVGNLFISNIMDYFCKVFYLIYYKIICVHSNPVRISKKSRYILERFNFKKFLETRRANTLCLLDLIRNDEIVYFFQIYKGYNLVGLPILVKNRNSFRRYLKRNGIYSLVFNRYWYLPPNENNYVEESKIYFRHILIPVNENLTSEEIKHIAKVVNGWGR